MIPVTQTKVVVKNSAGDMVVRGNCFAACVASMLELPIEEVPNVEVLFDTESLWIEVMHAFLNIKGYEMQNDFRFGVAFHGQQYDHVTAEQKQQWQYELKDKFYLVSGDSPRGISHMTIYKNGSLFHDPHPTREGIVNEKYFETIDKKC